MTLQRAQPLFYSGVEGGLDDEHREGVEEGTGRSEPGFGEAREPILRTEFSESPLHFTFARTPRQCVTRFGFRYVSWFD